ncbi:hypothetical protein AAFF_G00135710 [Aldrovandia affinis]|uniref:Uncharacterized protein n=1 Tax=Aldrovandia affinis TaxID=143900 RepID=A0AAD7W9B2_9TELE|nr:hypothetical protein AAFF_G00135710 [Aldrovandia affinis]
MGPPIELVKIGPQVFLSRNILEKNARLTAPLVRTKGADPQRLLRKGGPTQRSLVLCVSPCCDDTVRTR